MSVSTLEGGSNANPAATSEGGSNANPTTTPEGGSNANPAATLYEEDTWLDDFLKWWICFKIVSVSTIKYVDWCNMLTMYIKFKGESSEYGCESDTYIVNVEFSKVFDLFGCDYKKVKQIRLELENWSEENEAVIGTIRKFFNLYCEYDSLKNNLRFAYMNDVDYELQGLESSESDDTLDKIRKMFRGITGYTAAEEEELMKKF
jgi:hypothetical protein